MNVDHFGFGHLRVEEEVESLEGFIGLKGCTTQALLELLAFAPFDLIMKHAQ
jgi:hypothetical protein